MALSLSQKNQISRYQIQIQEIRKQMEVIKKRKKDRVEYFSRLIASCKDATTKRDKRKLKIYEMNNFSKALDAKKKQLEQYKLYIKNIKVRS